MTDAGKDKLKHPEVIRTASFQCDAGPPVTRLWIEYVNIYDDAGNLTPGITIIGASNRKQGPIKQEAGE